MDKMLDAGNIEPIEEYESISPMVVHENKTSEFCICVDLPEKSK